MALIKEDLYPKRPTRESLWGAVPAALAAVYFAVAPWIHGALPALEMLLLEVPFMIALAFAAVAGTSRFAFARWTGILAASALLLAGTFTASYVSGRWEFFVAAILLLAAHATILVHRAKWLHRHLLVGRCVLNIGLLWAVGIGVALLVTRFVPDPGAIGEQVWVALGGAVYFALMAALDAFRILAPPPPGAGPGWWKWDAPSSAHGRS